MPGDWDSPDCDADGPADGLEDHEYPDPADCADPDEGQLRRCPACRALIYVDAEKCPACDEWIMPQARTPAPWRWLALSLVAALVALLMFRLGMAWL